MGIREKRFALIIRIYVFLAVMAEALLVFINVNHHKGIWWSAITAGVFIYIYLIMKIGIQNDAGYRSKIIFLTIFSIGPVSYTHLDVYKRQGKSTEDR